MESPRKIRLFQQLQVIKRMHDGAMEAQKQNFQLELEYMGSKIYVGNID